MIACEDGGLGGVYHRARIRMTGSLIRPAPPYFLTYFCTRQFSVSATNTSSRGLTAM